MPAYIHSDRGADFMITELCNFLHQKEIAPSLTPTSYNPQGGGQPERYNGTVLEPLLSPSRLRVYWHCTRKSFSLMHYTLFDHCSVVLQTRLPMRDIQLHSVVYCWEVYSYLVYYPRDNSPQATRSSSLIGVPGGGVELLKANTQ